MDLNICLYCEKHLPEENMTFCSIDCQTNEASKPPQEQLQSNDYYFHHSSSISSSRSTCSDISFQRRLSFSSSVSSTSLSSFYPKAKRNPTKSISNHHVKSSNSFLFTNTSIYLLDRIQDLNKNFNQNVYTSYFFS